MKKVFIAIGIAMLSPVAFAQNCLTPGGPLVVGTAVSGNTCGGSNEFSQVCNGGLTAGGPSRTYKLEVGAGNNFTVTVTPTAVAPAVATYDAAIYLVGPNACSATAPCPPGGDADDHGLGEAETFSVSGLAPGTYYVVVASTNLSDTGASCGAFDLQIAGTLPVEVQGFSVE